MGVDDFGTFENFISLLKKNLTAEYKTWDEKNLTYKKIKDIELEFTEDEKLKFPNDPENRPFFFYDRKKTESSPLGDIGDFDFGHLIINFKEKSTNENEMVINLNKLYNHSLEFAKNDSNKEENGEQRA